MAQINCKVKTNVGCCETSCQLILPPGARDRVIWSASCMTPIVKHTSTRPIRQIPVHENSKISPTLDWPKMGRNFKYSETSL